MKLNNVRLLKEEIFTGDALTIKIKKTASGKPFYKNVLSYDRYLYSD